MFFVISIHALRTEGDCLPVSDGLPAWNFYPRPPYGGRREFVSNLVDTVVFLSTPSVRRATIQSDCLQGRKRISIHALRTEGDHLGR